MDQERERIRDDLRGLLKGDIHCSDIFLQLYASDASIYEVKPLGVVRPRNTADVVACVQYAAENHIPIHARGAGSGLSGESLGTGLVIDFAHYMRRIIRTDQETVTVQPGVTLAQLNHHLSDFGRVFGPDPANRAVTTMGSVLALDASGSRWLKYGSARQHVESLRVVLADGEVIELAQHPITLLAPDDCSQRVSRLARDVGLLVEQNRELIGRHWPRSLVNRCGYYLKDVVRNASVDLAQVVVGSEGTLGLITEATVRTHRLPNYRGVALLLFERLELAARAALEVPRFGAWCCDLVDRRLLSLACEYDVRYQMLLPRQTEALLLIETQGDDAAEVRGTLQQIIQHAVRRKKLAFDSRLALEPDEVSFFWRLTERVVPSLYRLKGSTRALPFVEDLAVPPEQLPDFLIKLQNILKEHEITASLFAHAGHGQLHIRPFLDLADTTHVRQLHHLAKDLYQEVIACGGTISGEHGVGLSRTWFMRDQWGPLYDVFVKVKQAFDPENLLNPGKVVAEVAQPVTHNLRPVSHVLSVAGGPDDEDPVVVPLQLNWTHDELALAARTCNGCGSCRTQSVAERMCPIFRFAPAEESTPRAKANLMRAIETGRLDSSLLASEEFKQIADLCVNCHQCRAECPAEVDIPKLMVECKGQYVATNGVPWRDWLFTHLDSVAQWCSPFSSVANWAIGNRLMRWLGEKTLGLAQGRKLPRLSLRSYLRRAARRRLTRPSRAQNRKVVYFVDTYANWFDTELAEAFVAVLEHNGISVYVPAGQLHSAMPLIALGSLEKAKDVAKRNVRLLADAIRQGYEVVATEPSAALALSHEYPNLLDDDETRLVAAHSSEGCSYLWKLHLEGKLELDLKPINLSVAYHEPCHIRALQDFSAGENLLRLIPGLVVQRVEKGCSGMAGTFGLQSENYRTSLRVGWELISSIRHSTAQMGTTECSACKIQMEQGTTKPTLHPLKLLAVSYGVIADGNRLLARSSQELYVS